MALGQRLKEARLAAELSQRQLCQGLITRNMLSLIENGSARPSMEVLCALAARLERPVSWFLEEPVVTSLNGSLLRRAKEAWTLGDYPRALELLQEYRQPDPLLDDEWFLLESLCCLALARQALDTGKNQYALSLLRRCEEASSQTPYFGPEHHRARCLLLARLDPSALDALPPPYDELQLRAARALEQGDPQRAAQLLEAAASPTDSRWQLLRGRAALAQKQYAQAVAFLHQAEPAFPRETAPLLEICYRELEDYKKAYFYATKEK